MQRQALVKIRLDFFMLDIQSLLAGYGPKNVLHGVSLQVARGEVTAIIGPNGCGKSTLLRGAAGLLKPRGGSVRIGGDDVFSLETRERARRVALLPQSFEGGAELLVEEMTLLGRTPHLSPYGAPSKRDREIAEAALESVGAAGFIGRRIGQLSGGERQRVLLARALAQQPRVLLLDEPISNLDIRYQCEILGLARRVAKTENLAVVAVLHQINLASAVADSMLLLNEGRPIAQGAPGDVMTQQNLESVYQTPLRVAPHPLSGKPQAQMMWEF
jgi:iron complex transport system ATP-binding protein